MKIRDEFMAITSLTRNLSIRFDPDVASHRRNLMFVITISLALNFITPMKEINLGLIKGELISSTVLYISVIGACLYQLIYFWTAASSQIHQFSQFQSLKHKFFHELGARKAWNSYQILTHNTQREDFPVLGGFKIHMNDPESADYYLLACIINDDRVETANQYLPLIKKSDDFEIERKPDGYHLTFKFKPTKEEHDYIEQRYGYLWLLGLKNFMDNLLPIILAVLAIFLISLKI